MIDNIYSSKAYRSLCGLIKSKYGKTLKLNPVFNMTTNTTDEDKSNNKEYYFEADSIQIPIYFNETFLAQAAVLDAIGLSEDCIMSMVNLVRMVLEPALYRRHLDHSYPLCYTKNLRLVQNTSLQSLHNNENVDVEDKLLFIQAKNVHTLSRFSMIVHEIKNNWSFVRFSDISDQVQSLSDLQDLGQCTILVDDLLNLSAHHRTLITEFLKLESTDNDPLVIIGITHDISNLVNQEQIPKDWTYNWNDHLIIADEFPLNNEPLKMALSFYC